ncbi:MAG: hypothetical protein KBT36_05440 [Kurthia sp.]|nr:hypothetical protein [Candidatus Kurthia equi]
MFIIKKLLPILVVLILALAACGDKEQTTNVPDPAKFKSAQIQTIHNNDADEKDTIVLKDKEKVQEVLKLVDGLKTKEQNITKTEKEMKKVDSYFFYFENKKVRDDKNPIPYSVFMTDDGRIFFTHSDIDELMVPQRSVEKHPEIVKQIKEIVGLK